jgi:hypothetical protein
MCIERGLCENVKQLEVISFALIIKLSMMLPNESAEKICVSNTHKKKAFSETLAQNLAIKYICMIAIFDEKFCYTLNSCVCCKIECGKNENYLILN